MQKSFYDNKSMSPEDVVGSYKWHEKFPYESQLLYKRGDIRLPLFENTENKVALDFGCGPGRMVARMAPLFERVDGVDISQRLLDEASKLCPESNFYLSSGVDLGSVKKNEYDFVFSTIAMQHIAVHSFRLKILKEIYDTLKVGGKINIQMAFNIDFPFTINKGAFTFGDYKVRFLKKNLQNALWKEDKSNAASTNGNCDAGIGYTDIPEVVADFETFFDDVSFWFYDVRLAYHDLDGEKHGTGNNYWPTHWIFISGVKKEDPHSKKKSYTLKNIWNKKNAEYNCIDRESFLFKIREAVMRALRKSRFYPAVKNYIKNNIL